MLKVLLCAAALLLTVACSTLFETPREPPKSLEEQRAESLAKLDRKECEAKGGRVEQAGMLGLWRCTIVYADAGKSCSDDSDCKGQCRGADGVTDYGAAPGTAKGICQADDSPFGCYATIVKGTVQSALCVD